MSQAPHLFNFTQISRLLMEDEQRQHVRLFKGIYLIFKGWVVLYGRAYCYRWFFCLPWILCSCCRICSFPHGGAKGMHEAAKTRGSQVSKYATVQQLIVWVVALRSGSMLDFKKQTAVAAIAGLLVNYRSGPLQMVKAALICSVFYLGCYVVANVNNIEEAIMDFLDMIEEKEEEQMLVNYTLQGDL